MPPAGEASRFAVNGGVRLQYVVAGAGPPLLLLHGIPDFWNGWRRQIEALHGRHRVAAMDLRGFNLSDKPADVRAYRIAELVGDVIAVLRDLGAARATLVGHDWGGLLGWWVATLHPDSVERLIVLAAPHPACYLAAREAGEITYRQIFRDEIVAAPPGAPFRLSAWVSDDGARAELASALRRSDPEGIRNYYRANQPASRASIAGIRPVRAPVLILHGVEDPFIPSRYYDLSARYVAAPCEIVRIPGGGHFIHRESAEQVTEELVRWLAKTQ
jgi:pimeloyl-ACP methyl ester carboxylesterase